MVPAPAAIPGPLKPLLQWLVFDLILPDDDFVQAVRKISSSILVWGFPMGPLCMIYPVYQWATGIPPPGPQLIIVGLTVLTITLPANYFCLRRWKHISDTHMAVFFACILSAVVVIAHTWLSPARINHLTISTFVALSRPSMSVLFFLVILADSIASIYNGAAREIGTTQLMFPGDYGDYEVARWATSMAAIGGSLFAMLGIISQAAEHERQLRARQGTQQILRKVVALLRDYDTGGVTRTLKGVGEGTTDIGLLQSLQHMNEKLLQYRPHLPNYVLQTASVAHVADVAEQGNGGLAGSRADRSGLSDRSANRKQLTSSNENLSESLGANDTSLRTLAAVDLTQVEPGSTNHSRLVALIVDSVFRHAAALKGSVHSVIGDTALVSWNATNRVADPALRAARFLCRVAADAGEAGCCVAGAACTGLAECDSAEGAGGLVAQLISASWTSVFNLLQRLAARYGAVLVDGATQDHLEGHVEERAVDAFLPAKSDEGSGLRFVVARNVSMEEVPERDVTRALGPPAHRMVYQLLRERGGKALCPYLEQSSDVPLSVTTGAVQAIMEGDYGKALSALQAGLAPARTNGQSNNLLTDAVVEELRQHCMSRTSH